MSISKSLYILLFIAFTFQGFTQIEPAVTKSTIIENIEGKDYYLHFVKKGETLFAIARAYDISVNDIFKSNPGSEKGAVDGKILKIPVKANAGKSTNYTESKEANQPEFFYHIVEKKETLYGISRKYGISIEEIKSMNPGLGDYPIEGETLKIPVKESKADSTHDDWEGISVSHTVEAGETLYSIARKYTVTTGEIINANPGTTAQLAIGDVLKIPNQVQVKDENIELTTTNITENRYTEHIVLKGETLYQIAKNYSLSIDSLKKHNPGLNRDLNPGQIIRVPKQGTTESYIIHKPEKRKKLEEIAKLYDVNYGEVERMNPDINRRARPGQEVRIPVQPDILDTTSIAIEPVEEEKTFNRCFDNPAAREKTYNVALMLPLFLEEVDSLTPNLERDIKRMSGLPAFRFLDFYAGFKMAVDSMQKKGMHLNLFVYDVDHTDQKVNRVLKNSELARMDLIVGPLYSKAFAKVSDFAKTFEIPIVNPLSEREEVIYNNPYVFKLRPSEEDQLDRLVTYLADTYPRENIVIVRHHKYKYQSQVSFIRNSLNIERPSHIYLPNQQVWRKLKQKDIQSKILTENKMLDPDALKANLSDSTYFTNLVKEVLYMDDSISGLKLNLSEVRKNIVIAISDDIVFSKQLLSELNKLGRDFDIMLMGLPTWNKYNDLESQHLLNLKFHAFTYSAVVFNNLKVKQWIRDFRKQYNTEPSTENFAFDGFDTGWYFLNALYNFGEDFNQCLDFMNVSLLQTRFEFKHSKGNGYRNAHWNLGKYQDYKFRKITYLPR